MIILIFYKKFLNNNNVFVYIVFCNRYLLYYNVVIKGNFIKFFRKMKKLILFLYYYLVFVYLFY